MITLHFHLQPQYKYELFQIYFTCLHCTGRYELNKLTLLPMCGFIAQMVEHRTGIAEVMGWNPIEALIFFRLLSNCLNWKIYCDDHTSLSSTTAVQIWIISYTFHIKYMDWSIHKDDSDPNIYYDNFLHNQCFPLQKGKYNSYNLKPWVTKALLKSIKRKNVLYKNFIKSPTTQNKSTCYDLLKTPLILALSAYNSKTSSVTPIFYSRIVISMIRRNFLQSLKKFCGGGSEPP